MDSHSMPGLSTTSAPASEPQAEDDLRQREERFRALTNLSSDWYWETDANDRFTFVSEGVQRLFGIAPERVLGKTRLDLAVRLNQPGLVECFTKVAKREPFRDIRYATSWSINGVTRYTNISGEPLFENGAFKGYRGIGRDITKEIEVTEKLHKYQDRLVSMLESIGEAFLAVDRDWRVTYANGKSAEFIGLPQENLIGKIVWEAVPEILTSSVFPYCRAAMESREKTFFEAFYEPARAWIEVRAYPNEDGLSVYFHDITARRQAESAIRDSERRFREVIEMTPAGYIVTDAQGRMLDVNPALCSLSGYAEDELVGQSMMQLFPVCPCDGALLKQGGATAVHGTEAVIKHKEGHPVYVLVNANIKRDADGQGLSLTAILTDITERKHVEARFELLATHDALTGLPNRALLNERLQRMLDSAPENESVAVIFIDLDRFKEVNDSMGHEPGDVLLRQVARRLHRAFRTNDIVARLGGDEFVVAAHCSKGADSARKIIEKLFSALASPFDITGQEVFLAASVGISMFPQDGDTKELLFQNADTAMYRAKAAGRNGYRFFEAEMSLQAKTRMKLEHSLRRALERNEFELHYQPRIDLRTMGIVGMEALIRWNHPELGRVAPMQFIPIAEERGLIGSIGRWVLEEACKQTRRLMDKYDRPLRVSVNLSARQLKSRDILEQVQTCLRDADLPPHLLELELTESAIIEDMELSAAVLKELKKLGILLSVDDFGTGYSGLAYLRRFPLDTLKLDRSFVEQQGDGVSNFKFIKAFVDLAHALNLSVVAEGVETNQTLQFLREATCDEAQGFFLAKPLPLDAFEVFLSRLPARNGRTKPA